MTKITFRITNLVKTKSWKYFPENKIKRVPSLALSVKTIILNTNRDLMEKVVELELEV